MTSAAFLLAASLIVNPQERRTIRDSYICGGVTNFNMCRELTSDAKKGLTVLAGQGSGFFISSAGDILTNEHVVKDAAELVVIWNNSAYRADVVDVNREKDLALIRIKFLLLEYTEEGAVNTAETKRNAPIVYPLGIPLRNTLAVGQEVYVVGYPIQDEKHDLKAQATKGIIASLGGFFKWKDDFQVDAPIEHGNSGGPVVDSSGRVVGVAAHGSLQNKSGNYAVKFEAVRAFLGKRVWLEEKPERPLPPVRMLEETMRSTVLVLNYRKNDGTVPETDENDSSAEREMSASLQRAILFARLQKVRGNWDEVREQTDDLLVLIPGNSEVRKMNEEARDRLGLHLLVCAEADGRDVPAQITPVSGITNTTVLCGEAFPVAMPGKTRGFPVRARLTWRSGGRNYIGYLDEFYNWHGTKEVRVILTEQADCLQEQDKGN